MTLHQVFCIKRPIIIIMGLFAFSLVTLPTHAQTAQPSFEVATVRPAPNADPNTGSWSTPNTGRFTATHLNLTHLIQLAYNLDASQIANKPGWLDSELYDVHAKPEDGIKLSREELRPRLQNLLRQRFHLVVHTETRSSHGYALIVAKNGSHLLLTKGDHFPGFRINVSPGELRGANWSMPQLAQYLTDAAGFPVVDSTGITGSYDIAFSYNPAPDAESPLPTLAVALKDATGLTLKPQNIPVEILVIDSVDKVPTDN